MMKRFKKLIVLMFVFVSSLFSGVGSSSQQSGSMIHFGEGVPGMGMVRGVFFEQPMTDAEMRNRINEEYKKGRVLWMALGVMAHDLDAAFCGSREMRRDLEGQLEQAERVLQHADGDEGCLASELRRILDTVFQGLRMLEEMKGILEGSVERMRCRQQDMERALRDGGTLLSQISSLLGSYEEERQTMELLLREGKEKLEAIVTDRKECAKEVKVCAKEEEERLRRKASEQRQAREREEERKKYEDERRRGEEWRSKSEESNAQTAAAQEESTRQLAQRFEESERARRLEQEENEQLRAREQQRNEAAMAQEKHRNEAAMAQKEAAMAREHQENEQLRAREYQEHGQLRAREQQRHQRVEEERERVWFESGQGEARRRIVGDEVVAWARINYERALVNNQRKQEQFLANKKLEHEEALRRNALVHQGETQGFDRFFLEQKEAQVRNELINFEDNVWWNVLRLEAENQQRLEYERRMMLERIEAAYIKEQNDLQHDVDFTRGRLAHEEVVRQMRQQHRSTIDELDQMTRERDQLVKERDKLMAERRNNPFYFQRGSSNWQLEDRDKQIEQLNRKLRENESARAREQRDYAEKVAELEQESAELKEKMACLEKDYDSLRAKIRSARNVEDLYYIKASSRRSWFTSRLNPQADTSV